MREICGIYMIKNKINGKVYIGQTQTIYRRFVQHKSKLNNNDHINCHLQAAWKKYGNDAFEFIVLEECELEKLDEREIYWIDKYDAMKNGYNQTLGGGGMRGWVTPEEVAKKHRGRNNKSSKKVICLNTGDVFYCIRDAATAYNIHFTLITMCCRKKIKSCGGNNPNYLGYIWRYYDDYQKMEYEELNSLLLSIVNSNNCARAISHKKQKNNKKQERLLRNRKMVLCVDTGEVFESISHAASHYGINSGNISSCCNGKAKSAGGMRWVTYIPGLEVC